ncbi:MAG: TonB-dependent receptor [Dysgonamonadaceae bacterium]|jgi:outer membrane receptor protein involved in Fe transport|nr:TonB-dependent receptor [Dysgonamonadaceae bacterium]
MQNKLKTGFFTFFLLLLPPASFQALFAGSASKEITGFVHDSETREPIIGATVRIKDTTQGAATGVDGHYAIAGLSGEKCTLVFSYLSYKTVEVECHLNAPVTGINIAMETDVKTIGEVVVKGRMRSHTENNMLLTVKSLPQVTSGISAAQIAKSPDRIASEVVRRIPGITVIDDRFIIVRGLSQRYNNAWINELAVPSTETDSRAFPLDLVPSSQIDHLLVYKSPSPEIPGDFSGGFVKIATKDVPDENRTELNYATGFNTNTLSGDLKLNPGSRANVLGFDFSRGFKSDWSIREGMPLPDQRLAFLMTRRMETADHKVTGNMTSITYSNTYKGVRGMKNARYGIYSATADRPVFLDNYFDNQFSNDVRLGAMHNWSFVPNPSNRIEFKNLLNLLGRNRLTERSGTKDMSSLYYREQTEMLYSSRLTYSGQFAGTHDLSPNQTLRWNTGYSYANKEEPDRRIITCQAGIGHPEKTPPERIENENIKRYFQELNDHNFSAALNYKWTIVRIPFRPVLKAGIYGEYRTRNYAPQEFIYRYDKLSYEERQDYLILPFEEMLSSRYLDAGKVYLDDITLKTNAYTASVQHAAGYAVLEIPYGKWNLYAGVRFEHHSTKLGRDRSDAPDLNLKTSRKTRESNGLPSANLTYKFTDKHQLRIAYGRSLNRPELREISPSVYFDFDLFSEIGGNERLKTALINNIDLRYEFYPGLGETMSLGVFYKQFNHPIEWTYIDMGGSLRYNYENADRAESWGIELDIRKKLDFIGLPYFSLVLNTAWIASNVHFKPGEVVAEPDRPMQGQSPYVINTGLFFRSEKMRLDASLLYNRIGKRIVGLGKSNSIDHNINTLIPDSYEMPRNELDFTVSKAIGKRIEIRCSVKDILSEDVLYKQFPKFEKDGIICKREQITRQYNPGQSVFLGVSFILN